MSNVPNQNGSGLEQQFAGLDLQGHGGNTARYVPPHLRNKVQSQADNNTEKDRGYDRGDPRGRGGSGNYSRGRDSRTDRSGDYSSFNTRNRRDNFQNGEAFEGRNAPEYPGGSGGGGRFPDREREAPRNDRWKEPEKPRDNGRWSENREGGGGGGGGGGGRWTDRGRNSETDWTVPLPRDERVELELFGTGNTGINFSKYEDIPVEATGEQVPSHITSMPLPIKKQQVCDLISWMMNKRRNFICPEEAAELGDRIGLSTCTIMNWFRNRRLENQTIVDGLNDADATRRRGAEGQGSSREKEDSSDEEKLLQYYNMDHLKRGLAVIFNHYEFDNPNLETRVGTMEDCQKLHDVLTTLKFKVEIHNDLEYGAILEVLSTLAEVDHSNSDCLLIAVLSHGDKGIICAKDQPYQSSILWEQFSGDRCPTLAGKPKIFLIQACRGHKLDLGIEMQLFTQQDASATDSTHRIPVMADIVIMYSTFVGYVSYRSFSGSWFIQSLCRELKNRAMDQDLLTILTCVNHTIAQYQRSVRQTRSMVDVKQIGTVVSSLTSLLQLN